MPDIWILELDNFTGKRVCGCTILSSDLNLQAWVLDNDTDERTEPELYIPEHEEKVRHMHKSVHTADSTIQPLTPMPTFKTWLHAFGPHFVTICGVVVCSGLAKWLRTGAIVLYKFIVGSDQNSKEEEDGK